MLLPFARALSALLLGSALLALPGGCSDDGGTGGSEGEGEGAAEGEGEGAAEGEGEGAAEGEGEGAVDPCEGITCSGKGTCVLGVCDCDEGLSPVGGECLGIDRSCLRARTIEGRVGQPEASAVALFFAVDNCDGFPVADLGPGDFAVTEDGAPISVAESAATILPRSGVEVYVSLVVDVSASVTESGALSTFADGALRLVRSVAGHPGTPARFAVQLFDGSADLYTLVDYTRRTAKVEAALESLKTLEQHPSGRAIDPSTNLYGAVVSALQASAAVQVQRRDWMRGGVFTHGVVLLFTDGRDQAALVSAAGAYAAVEATTDDVISLGFGGPEAVDAEDLGKLGRSGSVVAATGEELSAALDTLAAKVRGQRDRLYLLGYCSPKRAGQHTVAVGVPSADSPDSAAASFGFDATGFSPGCTAQTFALQAGTDRLVACGERICGGLACGGPCDDREYCVRSESACVGWGELPEPSDELTWLAGVRGDVAIVALGHSDEREARLARVPLNDVEATTYYEGGAQAGVATLDGEYVYYTRRDPMGIYRAPIAGGEPERIDDGWGPIWARTQPWEMKVLRDRLYIWVTRMSGAQAPALPADENGATSGGLVSLPTAGGPATVVWAGGPDATFTNVQLLGGGADDAPLYFAHDEPIQPAPGAWETHFVVARVLPEGGLAEVYRWDSTLRYGIGYLADRGGLYHLRFIFDGPMEFSRTELARIAPEGGEPSILATWDGATVQTRGGIHDGHFYGWVRRGDVQAWEDQWVERVPVAAGGASQLIMVGRRLEGPLSDTGVVDPEANPVAAKKGLVGGCTLYADGVAWPVVGWLYVP